MPAGLPYFAWIDATETTFGAEHMRWDESVFSFTLKQDEGDPASLTAVVRRPRNVAGDPIGLLGPDRKIWVWFALDCGPALIKFRGRLVGIPTSIFEELVTLEFVARPVDVVAQKEALADTLRVLPYYDEAMIDPDRRNDPEVVLEGYTKIWHYDRDAGPTSVTVSDEISGEDGLVEFLCVNGDVLYDGLGLSLTSGPLSRVDINAEFTWTQQANGTVDLTQYLISHWPKVFGGEIYLNAADWPKNKANIGDGWEVADSHAQDIIDKQTYSESRSGGGIVKFADGSTSQANWSSSTTTLRSPRNVVSYGKIVTNESSSVSHSKDGDGADYVSSVSVSYSDSTAVVVVQAIKPTLVAGYSAERQCTEKISFTLYADVQPILTDPEDGEALRIDDIRSVNLSEVIDGQPPIIGNTARRSYIATERGNLSLEHLIALARAHLMKRARVVEIAFVPKLARMPEVTLRKNAFLAEPRIGETTGKIIGYSIALDGSDGRINCEVKIGCTIGRGGTVAAADGTPTYCTIDYAGPDYQQFINRVVLFPLDLSVGYQPPVAAPNDDGIEFLSTLRAEDVIEIDLIVEYGPEPAHEEDGDPPFNFSGPTSNNDKQNQQEARSEWIKNVILPPYETRAKFKLKSMTREFSTDYELQVTDLMVPTGIDLEAV
jgi:hypothetical protein